MGEIVVIDKGLTPGETIVTEGQLRLEQGTSVQPSDRERRERRGGGGRRRTRRTRRARASGGKAGAGRAADRAAGRQGAPAGGLVNISETFIRRPIATSLLMAAIALFGVVAYRGAADQRSAGRRVSDDQRRRRICPAAIR